MADHVTSKAVEILKAYQQAAAAGTPGTDRNNPAHDPYFRLLTLARNPAATPAVLCEEISSAAVQSGTVDPAVLCRLGSPPLVECVSALVGRGDIPSTHGDLELIDTQKVFSGNRSYPNRRLASRFFSFQDAQNTLRSVLRAGFLYYLKTSDGKWTLVDSGVIGIPAAARSRPLLACGYDPSSLFSLFTGFMRPFARAHLKWDCYFICNAQALNLVSGILDFSPAAECNYQVHLIPEDSWADKLGKMILSGYPMTDCAVLVPAQVRAGMEIDRKLAEIHQTTVKRTEGNSAWLKNNEFPPLSFSRGAPGWSGKVLFTVSQFTTFIGHAANELSGGFDRAGCRSLVFRERKNSGMGYSNLRWSRILRKWQPQLLLSINNFRDAYSKAVLPRVPFVTWIQDSAHDLTGPGADRLLPDDHLFVIADGLKSELQEKFPVLEGKEIHVLPPLVSEDDFFPDKNLKQDIDISYIGHLPAREEVITFFNGERLSGSPLETSIHQILAILKTMTYQEIREILRFENKRNSFLSDSLDEYSGQLSIQDVDKLKEDFRHKIAQAYIKISQMMEIREANLGLLVIGGEGWELINGLNHYCIGSVTSRPALNALYNRSRINLNLAVETSFHPKISEVGGAGGFVLTPFKGNTDYQGLDSFFSREEVPVVSDADLVSKIEFYLGSEGSRKSTAALMHDKVTNNFTTAAGARKILETVFG